MSEKKIYQHYLSTLETQLELLPDKPEETAASTLHALWQLATGNPMSVESAAQTELPGLDANAEQKLAALVQSRLDGTPLAHLTQRQHFMGLEFTVGPQALVPRKETEILARAAEEILTSVLQQQKQLRIIDVCTGAGNIALYLAHSFPEARVYAADLSGDAVELARQNAGNLGLEDRVEFRVGDLLEPFADGDFFGTLDLLTCNPPYISSGRMDKMHKEIAHHEPKLAFDGGPFGMSLLGKLLKLAPRYLKPGAWLVFEVGLGQGEHLYKRLQKNPDYHDIKLYHDSDGNVRVLALQT